jgi:hypothetical protein
MEQRDYDQDQQQQMADQCIPNLNPDQHSAFDQIMHAVNTHSSQCFFLHGPGETGKTYVYNTLCYALRAKGTIILCVASSGIAALILMGGHTSHFHLKIPIAVDENSFCSIKRGSLEAEWIQQTSLLIYDEITMQHRHCQEAFDRTCGDIHDSDMPFGGLTVVFGGDFQQILPVIVKGSHPEIVNVSSSYIWSHLKILSLKVNMRLGQNAEEANFTKWQLEVGHGQHTDEDANITLPLHKLTLKVGSPVMVS